MSENKIFKVPGIPQKEVDEAREDQQRENERKEKEMEENNRKTPIKELLDIDVNK